jgi:Spy/CpxP family protein refolding chaperone
MLCEPHPERSTTHRSLHPSLRRALHRALPSCWAVRSPHARLAAGLLVATALLAPTLLTAQPRQGPRRDNPIQRFVFPPDLVMSHQDEIGLSAEQRRQIIAEVQRMEADLVPLRFEISESTHRLAELLSTPTVEEEPALALVDRITELEGEIKKRHLTLVIRTKNLLTPEQQAKLEELRRQGGR